jgi:hypothetical protein
MLVDDNIRQLSHSIDESLFVEKHIKDKRVNRFSAKHKLAVIIGW